MAAQVRPDRDSQLVTIRDLRVTYSTRRGPVVAVDGIDLDIPRGKIVGLAGESGSGKSAFARAVIGLLPETASIRGSVLFDGHDLCAISEEALRRYRGREIALVFQDPMRSLNPVMTIGAQLVEAIKLGGGVTRRDATLRARELLDMVRMPRATQVLKGYAHQLSGGMRQRVMIAMALANRPRLLIADEPTTALDVTTEAAIMGLIKDLQRELGMSVLFISHDLNLTANYADRIAIMYSGKLVEECAAEDVRSGLRMRYGRALIAALPDPEAEPHGRLPAIRGVRPDPLEMPPGCRFHPRCDYAVDACATEEPALTQDDHGHWWACWNPAEVAAP